MAFVLRFPTIADPHDTLTLDCFYRYRFRQFLKIQRHRSVRQIVVKRVSNISFYQYLAAGCNKQL